MAPMISGTKINNNEVQELNENLLKEKDKFLKLRKWKPRIQKEKHN